MTIEEQIARAESLAIVNEDIANNCDMDNWMQKAEAENSAKNYRQLAEWLRDLQEAKQYLGELMTIVENFGLANINKCGRTDYACINCKHFDHRLNHDLCNDNDYFMWKHEQEAKELLRKI